MANCKSCGVNIEWRQSESGQWIPYDLNGTCHFETCPQAKKWRDYRRANETIPYDRLGIKKNQTLLKEFAPNELPEDIR